MSSNEWILAACAAVSVGLSKSGFGGMGMVAVLLMAEAMPPRESTGAILPLLIVADLFAVQAFRRHAVFAHVVRLVPPALVGIVTGYFLMPLVPADAFGRFIGWLTLLLTALVIVQQRSKALANVAMHHPAIAWPTGWLAGVTTMMANAAGAVMTLYLLACRLGKMEFVGTAAWYFLIINVLKIPFSASLGLVTWDSLKTNILLVPAVLIGIILGRFFLHRIAQKPYEILLLGFSAAAAIRLILK